ncbi:hypothetical protein KL909_002671 [Ogataea angusta]|nr:hypothetical protein KL909_002671 [Ogataea angusta]
MDQLTPEQENKLQSFKEFTSYNESDEQEKVLRLLTVCNWDLEIAVARYFDNDFPTLTDERPPFPIPNDIDTPFVRSFANMEAGSSSINISSRDSTAPRALAFDDPFLDLIPKLPKAIPINNRWKLQLGINTNYQERRRPTYALLPPVIFILMLFPKLIWLVGYGLNKLLGPVFPDLFRILGLRESPTDFPSKPAHTSKEAVSSYNIKAYVNDTLGETSDLPIFDGSFNEAFEKSKSELRWLMCILLNSEKEISTKFVKTYLNHESFIKFVTENDIILYVGDVNFPEPFEVGKTYQVHSVPYINLIANVSATGTTFPLMSIVTRYHNFETCTKDYAKKLVKRLQKIIDKYEPQLITQRYDRQEAELARLLRKQQDEAYEQSLLNDKIKQEEKKQKEEEQQRKLETLKQEEEALKLKQKQELAFLKIHVQSLSQTDEKSWKKGDYTTIQLRNHEGQRTVKKFYKDQTLYDIFVFVECKNFLRVQSQELEVPEENVLDQLEVEDVTLDDYQHEFKFELISPMPRIKFHADKNKLLKDVRELWPNGSLLIERIEDEDGFDEETDDS